MIRSDSTLKQFGMSLPILAIERYLRMINRVIKIRTKKLRSLGFMRHHRHHCQSPQQLDEEKIQHGHVTFLFRVHRRSDDH